MDCLFCKIIAKDILSEVVHEDDQLVVFKDINPAAKTHLLIVPKKHIDSIKELNESEGDDALLGHMFLVARDLAKKLGLDGYKLNFNVGKGGGQVVFHLHLHLLSND